MARAEPEPGNGGGGGWALPGRSHSAVRVAPLDPEQLRRVLEQVTRAQPPPLVLRDAAQQAALQRGPGAGAPRLLPPQVIASPARWKRRSDAPCAPDPFRGILLPPLLRPSHPDLCPWFSIYAALVVWQVFTLSPSVPFSAQPIA
ncbi:hypothetical protein HispidOSU_001976 [Sigmodon hispidus]